LRGLGQGRDSIDSGGFRYWNLVPEGKQSYRLNLEDGSWVQYGSKKERGTPCRRAGFSEGLENTAIKSISQELESHERIKIRKFEDRMSRGAASVAKERLTSYSTAAIQSIVSGSVVSYRVRGSYM
jgi:RNA-binding protein YhbY